MGDDHVLGVYVVESLSGVVHGAVDQLDEFLRCLVRELPWAHLALSVPCHGISSSALAGSALIRDRPLLGDYVFQVVPGYLGVHPPDCLGDVVAVLVMAVQVDSPCSD